MRNIEAEIIAEQLENSFEKNGIKVTKKVKEEIIEYANEYSAKRFNYLHKSLAVLGIAIRNNKGSVPDYIWNRIAEDNGFFNNISIEYLIGKNWRDIGRALNKGEDLMPKIE